MSAMSASMGQFTQYPLPDHNQADVQNGTSISQLNLPPIRADEGTSVGQPQQQTPVQTQHGVQPVPMPAPVHYWNQQGQLYPVMSADPNEHLRYPIPPADSRMMSGGRHKKEIKRRTKTGCLTCRKRRIKVSAICVVACSPSTVCDNITSNILFGRCGRCRSLV